MFHSSYSIIYELESSLPCGSSQPPLGSCSFLPSPRGSPGASHTHRDGASPSKGEAPISGLYIQGKRRNAEAELPHHTPGWEMWLHNSQEGAPRLGSPFWVVGAARGAGVAVPGVAQCEFAAFASHTL